MNGKWEHLVAANSARQHDRFSFTVFVAFLLAAAGAILALNASFHLFSISSDEVMLAALTKGVADHGLGFLSSWSFTSDNYTLDAWPLLALIYMLFGTGPIAVVVSGWVIYVFIALVLGITMTRMVGWRWAMIAAAIALSFGGPAVTYASFLTYTVSHNSTWLLALSGWALLLWRCPQRMWRYSLVFIVFCGTVSDPWFDAAFTLPVVVTLFLADAWGDGDRSSNRQLVRLIVSTYILARLFYWIVGEKMLGCFSGRNAGIDVHHIGEHAHWILLDISTMLGAPNHLWLVLGLLGLWVVLLGHVLKEGFERLYLTPRHVTFVSICAVSAFGLLAAGLLSRYTTSILSGRFFINVMYVLIALGVLGLATAYRHRWRVPSVGLGLGLLLFVGLGFYHNLQVPFSLTPESGGDRGLYRDLLAKHLGVGLGPYFMGVNATTSRVWRRGLRPVLPVTIGHDGRIAASYVQASRLWFRPTPRKPHEADFLIMPVGQPIAWSQAATKTFGKPDKILQEGKFQIWLWRKNLLSVIHQDRFANHAAWKRFNVARNRAGIRQFCDTLGVSDQDLQGLYSWLLARHLAD